LRKNQAWAVLFVIFAIGAFAAMPCLAQCPSAAGSPLVKTVPWVVPTPPLCSITPHDIISGQETALKATTVSTAAYYYWDYGDGSPAMAWTSVSDIYNLGALHTYTGSVGTSFTATVYVKDTASPTPNINSAKYYLTVRTNDLQTRVNIAIDKALWRMHREMRSRSGSGLAIVGYWDSGNYTSSGYYGNFAANTTAFLVNGHKPDSDPLNPNPYSETSLRGINGTLVGLASTSVLSSLTNAHGTFSPDGNSNGLRTYVPQSDMYQGGMVMDMLVAINQPATAAAVGGPGIVGQTYKNITQDMMDYYTYCQNINAGNRSGSWRYGCRDGDSDNSVAQWAAIGMMAAVDKYSLSYPPPIPGPGTSPVILANMDWLNADFDSGSGGLVGGFGYQPGYWYPWTPWAVTPSGMVQLAMTGQGRGTPGSPTNWDKTEHMMRNNFSGPLGYYYGLFSFTKSMLLNPLAVSNNPPLLNDYTKLCARDGFPSNNLTNCIDWYNDPSLGIAANLVSTQAADGYWWCHEQTTAQCYFETAWATIMLNKTVYASGLPVAVIDATPSTVINDGMVSLTGKNSFHQDGSKGIVSWDWDLSGTGSGPFNVSGVNQGPITIHTNSTTFPVSFPVRLRVTDNSTPTPQTAISILSISITNPPFPPTANAGGPYNICPQPAYLPFNLNGTGSAAAPGHLAGTTYPDNFITKYEWDLLGNGTYALSGALLSQPRVDAFYSSAGMLGSGSTILVGLRVTDNSIGSFGASANLQGTATASVNLRLATDQLCTKCVSSAQAIVHGAVPGKAAYIQLVWLETGAHHYNIYKSTSNNGPYTKIGTVTNTISGTGKSLGYTDNSTLTAGIPYYYRIMPATNADIETCQSNQANTSGTIPKGR
jgi:hypothetical protein